MRLLVFRSNMPLLLNSQASVINVGQHLEHDRAKAITVRDMLPMWNQRLCTRISLNAPFLGMHQKYARVNFNKSLYYDKRIVQSTRSVGSMFLQKNISIF